MRRADDLTVFVISAGEDVLDECRDALARQDIAFRVEPIVDVYPMSAAFQAMPDRCTTPYFLQVDADMILEPDAVRALYEGIRAAGPRTYMVYGSLFQEGFGVGGAVKCWKRSLFRLFGFRDVRTVDRDLYRRTRRLGLRRRSLERTVGVHRAHADPLQEHLKTKGDVEKWRFLGRPPEQYALPLVDGLLAGRPGTAPGLLGALLGALTARARVARSKDLRLERELYHDVHALLGAARPLDGGGDAALRAAFAGAYRGDAAERARLAAATAALFGGGADAGAALLALAER